MSGNLRKHDVSDLINQKVLVIGDGYRAKNSELSKAGLPFARAGNISNGFQFSDADCFPEDQLHKVGEKNSRPGDTVFTSKGTVGRFAFVRKDTPQFVYSPQLSFWRSLNESILHPRFLYYWMSSEEFYIQFKSVAGQTDMAEYVSLRDQRQMHITLPPLPEQRAIAHVLGTLDDKIELNRRMNETLEEMARSLFKSWFVDFDPVRAKAALKQHALGHNAVPDGESGANGAAPAAEWTVQRARAYLAGMDPRIADLFPDRLVDSELGEIPEGWEVKGLDNIAEFTNGLALQRFPPEGEEWLPVIKIAEMRRGYTDKTGRASANLDPRYIVEDGDLLFSWSGSLELLFWTHGRGALNQHLFKVTSDEFPQWFYWGWISEHLDEFRAIAAGKATTMGHIQRHHLTDAEVAVPPTQVIATADTLIGALVNQHFGHATQSRTLGAQRDTLLPKLVAGKPGAM